MAHTPARERRKQFIEAASRVISEKGVSGATTRAVAAEAGAPLATLHYVFENKENLLIELLRWSTTFNQDMLDEATVPVGSGLQHAAKQVVLAWRALERPLVFASFDILLWSLRTELASGEAATLYTRLIEQVALILERAAVRREKDIDLKRLAVRLLIVADGVQFGTLCAGEDYVSNEEVADMVAAIVQSASKHAAAVER
jgi:AcrR family transcriptional regulator